MYTGKSHSFTDFVITPDPSWPAVIHAIGIESPGADKLLSAWPIAGRNDAGTLGIKVTCYRSLVSPFSRITDSIPDASISADQ
ncbi:MAG: hypothetical protein U0Y68_21135 [Blastocatellia bacterium]